MYVVSSTMFTEQVPTDMGYLETEDIDDVLDAVRSALENGATQVHISKESYSSEGFENLYED